MSNLLSFGYSSRYSSNHPALVDRLLSAVGRPLADAECSIKALRQTGTKVRVIGPGMPFSADRRENRVNVDVGQNGNIIRIFKG